MLVLLSRASVLIGTLTSNYLLLAYEMAVRARHFAGITHASRRIHQGRWLQRSPSSFLQALPSSSVASFAPNIARPYYQGKSSFRATQSMFFNQRRIKDANAQRVSSAFRSPPACPWR